MEPLTCRQRDTRRPVGNRGQCTQRHLVVQRLAVDLDDVGAERPLLDQLGGEASGTMEAHEGMQPDRSPVGLRQLLMHVGLQQMREERGHLLVAGIHAQ